MRWGRWGQRLLAALAFLLAATPPAHAGPGHGDVFTATPRGIPADATVSAFADAPAFMAGEVLVSDGTRVQLCAYTVTTKDGVPIGVRTIAAAYTGLDPLTARTDDVYTTLEESQFRYTRERSWNHHDRYWNALRLYVTLPRIGGFMELFAASEAPGTILHAHDAGTHMRHGYEAVVLGGHFGADGSVASLGPKTAEWKNVWWGVNASGGCWASYPDPGQLPVPGPS